MSTTPRTTTTALTTIDYCSQNGCDEHAKCHNGPDEYTCVCEEGYYGTGKWCEVGNCADNKKCPENEECVAPTKYECQCLDGFERAFNHSCVDINECLTETHNCALGHLCVNTPGSYDCESTTSNIDFCARNSCHHNANCRNNEYSYACTCKEGYYGDGISCHEGNCYENHSCPQNEECVSSTGLQCQCSAGFEKQSNICVDIDECLKKTHNCQQICVNTLGSFYCQCSAGFEEQNKKCVDIDECLATHSCEAEQTCINTDGGFYCRGSNYRWILVLDTQNESNVPVIIDGRGESKEIEFDYKSRTQANGACSIIWHGKMYLFGGYSNRRQISVVDGCKLKKKGILPFKMNVGVCAQRDNVEIFICFQYAKKKHGETWKTCLRSIGPLEPFSRLPSSTYNHRRTSIAVTSGKLANC